MRQDAGRWKGAISGPTEIRNQGPRNARQRHHATAQLFTVNAALNGDESVARFEWVYCTEQLALP
jgi:hypothetical protein